MEFKNFFWPDSNIEKIEIQFDTIKLYIFNDALQKNVCVICTGFIGITNLLMWDDQIINDVAVREVQEDDTDPFIQMLFSKYNKNFNYGERWLNREIYDLQIRLTNHTTFHIYCQSIEVSSKERIK